MHAVDIRMIQDTDKVSVGLSSASSTGAKSSATYESDFVLPEGVGTVIVVREVRIQDAASEASGTRKDVMARKVNRNAFLFVSLSKCSPVKVLCGHGVPKRGSASHRVIRPSEDGVIEPAGPLEPCFEFRFGIICFMFNLLGQQSSDPDSVLDALWDTKNLFPLRTEGEGVRPVIPMFENLR